MPRLLACRKDGAEEMLNFIGENSSSKESVIAIQEVLERLTTSMSSDAEEEETEEEEEGVDSVDVVVFQLIRVLNLYALGEWSSPFTSSRRTHTTNSNAEVAKAQEAAK